MHSSSAVQKKDAPRCKVLRMKTLTIFCARVVGPKDKFKVFAGQVSQSLCKAPDANNAQAAANKTVDSDVEYFNMIRESLLTPQQERALQPKAERPMLLRMSLNFKLRVMRMAATAALTAMSHSANFGERGLSQWHREQL